MKFALVANMIGLAVAANESEYLSFVAEHGKTYGTVEEYNFRLALFSKKTEQVRQWNANVKDGTSTIAINHMADWTNDEYKKLLGYRKRNGSAKATSTFSKHVSDLPASVDWRAKGAVTPVKNQGMCGSCWAFSTTGSMEGRYQIAGNNLTSFSEEQFVDCSGAFGNEACNGGLMDDAFKYAEANMIETEAAYPYKGMFHGSCKATSEGVTEVRSFSDVTASDPDALMAAVAEGPVAVAIDASGPGFQLYFGGVMAHLCGTSLDHGVLIVGYGTQTTTLYGKQDYWLLKNSWGSWWGEHGYFKILREMDKKNSPGVCGIQLSASYPIF